MRLSNFVLILAKKLFAAGLCCAFCTIAFANDGDIDFEAPFNDISFVKESDKTKGSDKTSDLAFFALSLSGIQYKFGGNTPEEGFDCSGLVRYVFKEVLNKDLPRSAEEMSQVGSIVEEEELQAGDLVFFNTLKRAFSHVGIYVGENKFIHAPASGGKVRIENMSLNYWKQRFNGARRIIDRQDFSH